jgi:hypothetical protein
MKKSLTPVLKSEYLASAIRLILPRKQAKIAPQRSIEVLVAEAGETKVLQVPVYSLEHVPSGYCSRYARYAANELFDKKYPGMDAWNRRYHDEVVVPIGEIESIEDLPALAEEGRLKPGNIIGLHYPESTHNEDIDEQGNKASYTHVALYLGRNPEKKLLFVHEYKELTEVMDLEKMKERNLGPREILNTPSRGN